MRMTITGVTVGATIEDYANWNSRLGKKLSIGSDINSDLVLLLNMLTKYNQWFKENYKYQMTKPIHRVTIDIDNFLRYMTENQKYVMSKPVKKVHVDIQKYLEQIRIHIEKAKNKPVQKFHADIESLVRAFRQYINNVMSKPKINSLIKGRYIDRYV